MTIKTNENAKSRSHHKASVVERGVKCKIRRGWWNEGKTGIRLGTKDFVCKPVLWDDETDPTCHKTSALEFYT